jgi:hypothetical protein
LPEIGGRKETNAAALALVWRANLRGLGDGTSGDALGICDPIGCRIRDRHLLKVSIGG